MRCSKTRALDSWPPGWLTQAEVTFNHYGDRGSCDLVGWHPPSRCVLIVEIKASIGNVQEMLHRLDTKHRLGVVIATQLGWPRPAAVAAALVIADTRSARSVIARHAPLFATYATRGWAAKRWLRRPTGGTRLLWFQVLSDSDGSRTTDGTRVRSRPPAS